MKNTHKSTTAWHAEFESMLPAIQRNAQIAFRHLNPDAREEAVQETICKACQAYARLIEQGKAEVAFPSVLAKFAIRQTKEGRKVGGSLNCHDVLSDYCRHKQNLTIERLDQPSSTQQTWSTILVEDKHTGLAETAITRIDFAAWLYQLPARLQSIAQFLATGETTAAAAKRFDVSRGRISQLRRELAQNWHYFQAEEPTLAGL